MAQKGQRFHFIFLFFFESFQIFKISKPYTIENQILLNVYQAIGRLAEVHATFGRAQNGGSQEQPIENEAIRLGMFF